VRPRIPILTYFPQNNSGKLYTYCGDYRRSRSLIHEAFSVAVRILAAVALWLRLNTCTHLMVTLLSLACEKSEITTYVRPIFLMPSTPRDTRRHYAR